MCTEDCDSRPSFSAAFLVLPSTDMMPFSCVRVVDPPLTLPSGWMRSEMMAFLSELVMK